MNNKILELYGAKVKDFDRYVFQYKGYEVVLSQHDYAQGKDLKAEDLFIVVISDGKNRDYTYVSELMIGDKECVFSVIDDLISTF